MFDYDNTTTTTSTQEASSQTSTTTKEKQMLKIPVVFGQELRTGIPVVLGSMPVKHLLDRLEIPYLDALRKTGYQRKPAMPRIKRLADELRDGHADIPTSILINIRESKVDEYLSSNGDITYLEIPLDSEIKFFIVDGQHRTLAFKILYEEDFDKWGDYKVQFVAMIGADPEQEMKQFYTVNSTAKSVKTDLAYDILNTLSDKDNHIKNDLVSRGQTWKIEGQKLAELMHKDSSVWANKIRLANADKKETVLPVASLVNSLASPLKTKFFGNHSLSSQYEILEAYWTGISIAMPTAFNDYYKDYSIQKGLGTAIMNELLGDVIEVIRNKGKDVTDPKAYADVVKPMLDNLSAFNAEDEEVKGADFWLSGKLGGAAGAFSSSAGKKLLAAKLKANMPKLSL